MRPAKVSNFSYGCFKYILKVVKSKFQLYMFSDVLSTINAYGHKCILRHEVDISLKIALQMAEIESKMGVYSTYMIMQNSPLYSLRDKVSQNIIRRMINMGHQIGLHYYDKKNEHSRSNIDDLGAKINYSCKQLEDVTGLPVLSFSFHRPTSQCLKWPLILFGRYDAYSKELMTWYISDSQGRWGVRDPIARFSNPDKPLLQLLIHPIWWGNKHKDPTERLCDFFYEEVKGEII